MARALISIIEIANTVCEEVGDHTKKHQRSVLRNITRCYQNLHLFMTPVTTVKTMLFPRNNVIEMPPDFVYETKVGIKLNGKIILLKKNWDKIGNINNSLNHTEFSNYVVDVLDAEIDRTVTPFYNYKGELVLSAYGAGVNFTGMYEVDKNNGRIMLGSVIPNGCEVVVEYKSDGVSDGVKLVPIELEACLYNYGLWKYYFRKGDSRWAKSEQDYDVSYFQLETLYRFAPIDYISTLYRSEKGTINDLI